MPGGLETGFELDRRWHFLRGEMEQSKKPELLLLARVLAEAGTPYAIIGGVALQVWQDEPRTTVDIDLAVRARSEIPRAQLQAQGFRPTGSFEHSENWLGPQGTPIQFTDDPALAAALQRTASIELEGAAIRVLGKLDLLREKLRAGSDPARRRSKRLQDLADAQSLIESSPELAGQLSAAESELLARLPV